MRKRLTFLIRATGLFLSIFVARPIAYLVWMPPMWAPPAVRMLAKRYRILSVLVFIFVAAGCYASYALLYAVGVLKSYLQYPALLIPVFFFFIWGGPPPRRSTKPQLPPDHCTTP